MPLVNVDILEKVFTPEQKKRIIADITDVMVAIEGEPFRRVTRVKINEVREGQSNALSSSARLKK